MNTSIRIASVALFSYFLLLSSGIGHSQEMMEPLAESDLGPISATGEVYFVEDGACGDCNSCGDCGPCGTGCGVGPGGRLWVRGEYLLWWAKGMDTPPLVTTGPEDSTGAIDDIPLTQIIYGDSSILDSSRPGFRIRAGMWLDCSRRLALVGEYFSLSEDTESFIAASHAAGSPILYRPFFNVNKVDSDPDSPTFGDQLPSQEDAENVSKPGILAGSVSVDSQTRLLGAGIGLRYNLCCGMQQLACCDPCYGGCGSKGARFDFYLGYRYLRLTDGIIIREDLTSLEAPPFQGEFDIFDSFSTANNFHGIDIGVSSELTRDRWSLEMLGRLAIGTVEQVLTIDGQTVITGSAASDGTYVGGLYAQRTNIGTFSRNELAIAPELGVAIGYQLTPRLSVTGGYTFLYMSRVLRAAEQIDQDVNPALVPPEESPFTGPLRPRTLFNDNDYWAQGLNLGLQLTW